LIGSWQELVIEAVAALLLAWLVLLVVLAAVRPRDGLLSEALRILLRIPPPPGPDPAVAPHRPPGRALVAANRLCEAAPDGVPVPRGGRR
jgi:hypothetical protein